MSGETDELPELDHQGDELAAAPVTLDDLAVQVAGIAAQMETVVAAGTNQAFAITMLMERAEPIAEVSAKLAALDLSGLAVRLVGIGLGVMLGRAIVRVLD